MVNRSVFLRAYGRQQSTVRPLASTCTLLLPQWPFRGAGGMQGIHHFLQQAEEGEGWKGRRCLPVNEQVCSSSF